VTAVGWDFGDGVSVTSPVEGEVTVFHAYALGRVDPYPVRLTVAFAGSELAITHRVTVNTPPTVALAFSPAIPLIGEQITFLAPAADAEEPSSALDYQWSFGPGGAGSVVGAGAQWTYASAGMRSVAVTVTDSADEWDSANRAVAVSGPAAPVPGAAGDPPALRLLTPFPVVRLVGSLTRRGARVRRLAVRAPRGSLIKVRCRGRGRGCPVRRSGRRGRQAGGQEEIVLRGRIDGKPVRRFPALERSYRAGAVLEVLVWRAGRIGKYTRFAIRRGKAPRRVDRCLRPGAERGSRCPTG
jgi:hypothetical protein